VSSKVLSKVKLWGASQKVYTSLTFLVLLQSVFNEPQGVLKVGKDAGPLLKIFGLAALAVGELE
jgi:hypothetical protein